MQDPRSLLITGASSGIGEALALAYAGPGITLALGGRDAERLEAVAAACRQRGAQVLTAILDVTDRDGMERWIAAVDDRAPLDLVIANAGRGEGSNGSDRDRQTRKVFAVNVDGTLNTVVPVIPRLVARRRGQIAIMSSLVSFRGVPGVASYCASKAAVRVWAEGLRGDLHSSGVEVSVICPGFVASRMTAKNKSRMPFLMSAERSAAIIKRALERNRGRVAFPFPMYAFAWFISSLPPLLVDPLLRAFWKKR